MEALNDYFLLMIFLCLAEGLSSSLLHDSARDVSVLAIGVISLSALISPITGLGTSLDSLPNFGDAYEIPSGGLMETVEEAYIGGIESYISSEWSVSPGEVEVFTEGFDRLDLGVEELTVHLSGAAAFLDTRSIRERLSEQFVIDGGKCRVVISFD